MRFVLRTDILNCGLPRFCYAESRNDAYGKIATHCKAILIMTSEKAGLPRLKLSQNLAMTKERRLYARFPRFAYALQFYAKLNAVF